MIKAINIIGALITIAGSLFLAFSVNKDPGHTHEQLTLGKPKQFAVIEEIKFKWGLWLLVIGFLFQLVGIIWS